eukprot:6259498-Prymnesium_polylepis.1
MAVGKGCDGFGKNNDLVQGDFLICRAPAARKRGRAQGAPFAPGFDESHRRANGWSLGRA